MLRNELCADEMRIRHRHEGYDSKLMGLSSRRQLSTSGLKCLAVIVSQHSCGKHGLGEMVSGKG